MAEIHPSTSALAAWFPGLGGVKLFWLSQIFSMSSNIQNDSSCCASTAIYLHARHHFPALMSGCRLLSKEMYWDLRARNLKPSRRRCESAFILMSFGVGHCAGADQASHRGGIRDRPAHHHMHRYVTRSSTSEILSTVPMQSCMRAIRRALIKVPAFPDVARLVRVQCAPQMSVEALLLITACSRV